MFQLLPSALYANFVLFCLIVLLIADGHRALHGSWSLYSPIVCSKRQITLVNCANIFFFFKAKPHTLNWLSTSLPLHLVDTLRWSHRMLLTDVNRVFQVECILGELSFAEQARLDHSLVEQSSFPLAMSVEYLPVANLEWSWCTSWCVCLQVLVHIRMCASCRVFGAPEALSFSCARSPCIFFLMCALGPRLQHVGEMTLCFSCRVNRSIVVFFLLCDYLNSQWTWTSIRPFKWTIKIVDSFFRHCLESTRLSCTRHVLMRVPCCMVDH